MKAKLQNTYRHLLNFVANSPSRPVLNGIHFTPNGDIEATSSHILLRLLNRVEDSVDPLPDMVLHPKELREIPGTYPDVNRLFPTSSKATWLLSQEEAVKIAKFLKSFEKNSLVNVSVHEKNFHISNTVISSDFQLADYETGDSEGITLTFNCTYLSYIMAFIADCSNGVTELLVQDSLRPMVFKVEGLFEGLIAPVKTH
jgi:hypothetical protein